MTQSPKETYGPGEHAVLGASSAHRWMNCYGSVYLSEQVPEKPSSKYAQEGTLAHECAEKLLLLAKDGADIDDVATWENIPFQDEEMKQNVVEYVKFCLNLLKKFPPMKGTEWYLERRLELSKLYEMFGTADFSYVHKTRDGKHVGVIVDLKYGKGVTVEAENNPQLAYYACALQASTPEVIFDRVSVFIFQPRVEHPDGPARKMTLDRKALEAWFGKILNHAAEIETLKAQNNPDVWDFVPGDYCRWCPGAAICSARAEQLQKEAQLEFAPVKAQELIPPTVAKLSDDQIYRIIKHRADVESFLKRVEEYAISRFEDGNPIPGTKVVQGRSIRKWKDSSDTTAKELVKLGVKDPYDKKLKGITAIEREIGKGKIDHLVVKPDGKPKLVLDDDPRPAIDEDMQSVTAEFKTIA